MKKAVIYGRVSTEDKQEYHRQVNDLTIYAKNNDFKIIETFTEKASGSKADRVEYNKMLVFVEANKIHSILVTDLSRFGRMGYKTRVAIETLADKGVNIYFHQQGYNTLNKDGKKNSDTMMILGVLADMAEKDLENLRFKVTSGLRFSAKNNGAQSGKYKAYGFKSVDKKLVQEKEEVKVVKEIFSLYKSGLGCSQIANHLNTKRIKTRFNKVVGDDLVKGKKGTAYSWSTGTIVTMLKNRLYRGERWHSNGELDQTNKTRRTKKRKRELVATFEPIIDPLLFDQVQIIMKNKNNRPIRNWKNDNHLKGIIKCGVCGQPYFMHKRKDGHDNAYKCLSKKLEYDGKEKYCGSPAINIDKLLDSLYTVAARTIITKLKSTKSSFAATTESKINIKKIEVANAKSEVKKFENKINNLYEDYNERSITKTVYTNKKVEFEAALSKYEEQLSALTLDLKNLDQLKNRPVRDYYTKETFLREIRSVLTQVTIGSITPNSNNRIKDVFGKKGNNELVLNKQNVPVLVSVTSINGEVITYILSRFSKKILHLENGRYKVAYTLKAKSDGLGFEMAHRIDELIKKRQAA